MTGRSQTPGRPEPAEAARRLTAYTYGNILVLAVLVTLPVDEVATSRGALLVAGTGLSTFLAHLFSEVVGLQLVDHEDAVEHGVLRASTPILSATSVPLLLMVGGAAGWLAPSVALVLAQVFCIARIALTAFFVARFRGAPVSLITWLGSIGLAVIGAAVVAVKVLLTH